MNRLTLINVFLIAFLCLVEGQHQPESKLNEVHSELNLPQGVEPSNCTLATTKPTPEIKKYAFKTCIVAELAAHLVTEQSKYINFVNGTVDQVNSRCDNSTTGAKPMLVINFPCANLSLSIDHTNDLKTFVDVISVTYLVNGTLVEVNNLTPNFNTTQTGHYYKCNSEQTIPVYSGKSLNNSLVVSNLALEAYRSASGTEFYQIPEDCPLDSQPVSDLVRIGVGVCLIALVAIVLIAYFIGRRRWSERSTYESV